MEETSNLTPAFLEDVADLMRDRTGGKTPLALVRTYGCQQNVADGEKIKGILGQMGFEFTDEADEADFIIFNTCAVREHAEDRVYGNLGALKHVKRRKPGLMLAVCGCMTEQAQVAEKIKKSFPFVDIVFGTRAIHRLPELMASVLTRSRRAFLTETGDRPFAEGLPVRRDSDFHAWVPVMAGCDNFCSYCIVPYVRGREKSRKSEDILRECAELVKQGYKEITLLGQNVNSYGKGLEEEINFSQLLKKIDALEGDFRLRFMTSHPKDATKELFDTMAGSKHIPHNIHLPFQSGNDRVLKAMNRRYDRAQYLELIRYARSVMPDISFTSDVIVGFPGETYEEFKDTLSLVKEVDFTNLFTFIYSPRTGTVAAKLEDPVTHVEKTHWFAELLKVQEEMAAKRGQGMIGKTERVLVENQDKKTGLLSGRTAGGLVVLFEGAAGLVGTFTEVEITEARGLQLSGKKIG